MHLDSYTDKGWSAERLYAEAIHLIAQKAPLRILPEEMIIGSATLREATCHMTPALLAGKPAFGSVSHTTIGFDQVLKIGYKGLSERIDKRLLQMHLNEREMDVLRAMMICLDAMRLWHQRHMALLAEMLAGTEGEERTRLMDLRETLASVPELPPQNFRQALQSLWFMFAFQRLCGNWTGIGRMDLMLGPFLEEDLARGKITLDEARELLAHFWIKGCEWAGAADVWPSGDAQYYQNIVLGGIDENGEEVTNEVTYLILDVVEELRISDFPIAVRINTNTPKRLLRRIAEVQRLGGGNMAIYNETQIIESLVEFGYPLKEARNFANDGCWEIIIPGKTHFGYRPVDVFAILQRTLGVTSKDEHCDLDREFPDFESLHATFRQNLINEIDAIQIEIDNFAAGMQPASLVSLFVENCIDSGRGYFERGAKYNVCALHAGGLPDAGNSLYVIQKMVYGNRCVTLSELVKAMREDWVGHEDLRGRIARECVFYGNDSPKADAMVKLVFDDFLEIAARDQRRNGVLRPAGVSTFGREIEWRCGRGASVIDQKSDAILASNFSPAPGN